MNIYINKGSTIFRTITNLNYYDIDWKPATLHFETSLIKSFNVRCSENHPNYNLIISPINYINKIEFQYIFDTGFNGEKYNGLFFKSFIKKIGFFLYGKFIFINEPSVQTIVFK